MLRQHAPAICVGLVALAALSSASFADILVGDQLAGANGVRRYRESDGAFVGAAGGPAEIQGGVAIGPDGNIYIAAEDLDFDLKGEILRFNAVTGAPMGALVPLGQNGFGEVPRGLAFSNGSAFTIGQTTSPAGNGLLRFDFATGAYQGVAVPAGANGLGSMANVLAMPGGDLLVSDGSRLNRYNKDTFAFVGTFVAPGAGGIDDISGMTFGPDGNLYVSSWAPNIVDRFDGTTGAFMGTFVAAADHPANIAFGQDGNLYILGYAGTASSMVKRYDGATGAFIDTFLSPDPTHRPDSIYLISAPAVPEPSLIGAIAGAGMPMLRRRSRRRV